MGAYENPKFIEAPNYLAGTQAFLKTFQKGLDEGVAYGEELIADREEYEKGVYEAGDELKEELDAALGNTGDAKKKIQASLDAFYEDALKVDMPTKKGLAGIFSKPKEKRLGTHDLKKTQENFTNEVQGINTAFNYVYDPEIDIMENEDRGHENYKEKKAIYDAIKNNFKNGGGTDFNYKDGKFKGGISVKINGEIKKYSTAEIQAIFTASGKEQRDIIDEQHKEMQDGVFNAANAEVKNIIAKAKKGDYSELADASAEVKEIIRRRLGIGDGKGKMSQANEEFINNEYNNHADINLENKVDLLKKANLTPEDFGLDPKSKTLDRDFNTILESIADDTYNSGAKIYADRFGIKDPAKANDLYNRIKEGKKEIVFESYMQDMEDRGLMDDWNRKTKTTTTGSGSGSNNKKVDRYYEVQVADTNEAFNQYLDVIDSYIDVEGDGRQANAAYHGAHKLRDIFTNKSYKFDGSESTSIADVKADYEGNITIYAAGQTYKREKKEGEDGWIEGGGFDNWEWMDDVKSVTFSAHEPSDYKKLLMNFGAKSGSSSEYTREYEVKAHNELLIRGNELLQKGKLADQNYHKWFKELEKSPQGQAVLYQWAEKANGQGFDLNKLPEHWQPFLKKYGLKASYKMEGVNLTLPENREKYGPGANENKGTEYYMNMIKS